MAESTSSVPAKIRNAATASVDENALRAHEGVADQSTATLSPWGLESAGKREAARPFVTVVMPIRNEEKFIARSLSAVLTQDYPAERYEVLVADGMSSDGTRGVIARVSQAHPRVSVRVVDNPGRIVPTGINAAMLVAKGDVIVRVDGHTIIAVDYLRECVEALARSGADNVGGRMSAVSEGAFGQAVALATSSRFGVGGARFHYSEREEWVDTVYLGAWPREVFARIGLFDEEQVRNQDDEFNYRLRAHGGRILLSPRIRSKYYNRTTLRSLWRQYLQYGYWKVRVMQKHPAQMRPRQFVPSAFVMTLFGSLASSTLVWQAIALFAVATCSYVLANLAASALLARKASPKAALHLPLAFLVLHVAYGCGFVAGMMKFWKRWRDRPQSPTLSRAPARPEPYAVPPLSGSRQR